MAIFPCALWCKSLVIYFIHDCLCLLIPFPKVASSPFSLYFGNQQFFFFVFLIGGWLLYIIVMDFAVHQYESSIGTRVSPSSWTTPHLPPHPVPLGCHGTPFAYICESVSLLHWHLFVSFFSDSTNKWYNTMFVFLWLMSLNIVLSRFIYDAEMAVFYTFLWLSNLSLYTHATYSLSVHLLMNT